MGPASARSFSRGVGCSALGSFFAIASLEAGLAGVCIALEVSHCDTTRAGRDAAVLTVPGLNLPKNEVIVVVPGPSWEGDDAVGRGQVAAEVVLIGGGASVGHLRCWASPRNVGHGNAQHGEGMEVDTGRRTRTRADDEAGGRRGPEAWLGSC